MNMIHSLPSLTALKKRVAMLERRAPVRGAGASGFGLSRLDACFTQGGGAVHEVCAAEPEDIAAATAFTLGLALRLCGERKTVVWVRQDRAVAKAGRIHAPGLVELGIHPDRMLMISAPDEVAALRAANDAIRCSAVGVVVVEPAGAAHKLDLTASRRLTLTAEKSGVRVLLLHEQPRSAAAGCFCTISPAPR
jgi:protein ImuA